MKKDKVIISICSRQFNQKLLKLLIFLKKNIIVSHLNLIVIIVVNNKKKLNKAEQKIISKILHNIHFKIIYEKKIGISHARNKSLNYLNKSSYDYGCFLDDDCIIKSNFIKKHLQFIKINNCDIVGGPQLYKSKCSFLRVFELNYKHSSEVFWVSTNNVFFKKSAILKNNYFSNAVTKYGFGEDQLFFSKLSIYGKKIMWNNNPVYEVIQKEREYFKWFLSRNLRYGLTGILIDRDLYGNLNSYFLNIFKACFNLLKSILFLLLIPLRSKVNFFKSIAFFLRFIGRILNIIKIK